MHLVGSRDFSFALLAKNEIVMDLCSGISNIASPCECYYLSAVTDRRALVYDMRCMGRPLISWELPHFSGTPTVVDLYTYQRIHHKSETSLGSEERAHINKVGLNSPVDSKRGGSSLPANYAESIGEADDVDTSQYSVHDCKEDGTSYLPQTQESQFNQIQSQKQLKESEDIQTFGELEGSLLVSSLATGHILQLPFTVASNGTVLAPEQFASNESEDDAMECMLRNKSFGRVKICRSDTTDNPEDVADARFPVRYSHVQRVLDAPSFLCYSLHHERDLGGNSGVDIYQLLHRLAEQDKCNQWIRYSGVDKEIMDWQSILEFFPDTLGTAFVPFLHETHTEKSTGILFRQNVLGDIIVNLCVRRKDELEPAGMESNSSESENDNDPSDEAVTHSIIQRNSCGSSLNQTAQFNNVELVRNKFGLFRQLDLANSTVAMSEDNCVGNTSSRRQRRQNSNSAVAKLLGTIPRYLGRRVGKQCNRGDPIPLNAFATYVNLKMETTTVLPDLKRELEEWDLCKKAAEMVRKAPRVLTIGEIQRAQAIRIYRQAGA